MNEKNYFNPLETVTVEKSENYTWWYKFAHTFYIFFGQLRVNEQHRFSNIERGDGYFDAFKKNRLRAGLLDYVPFLFLTKILWITLFWVYAHTEPQSGAGTDLENRPAYKFGYRTGGVLMFLLTLLMAPLLIAQALLALAFTIVSSPIIFIVHVFLGPTYRSGKTPTRRSLIFNPFTWATGASLLAGIGFLIQGLDVATFAQAAAPLAIMQAVFVGIAALMLVFGVGRWIYEKYQERKLVQYERSFIDSTITSYLGERITWMSTHSKTAIVFCTLGALAMALVLGFTIAYFTGGLVSDSFIGQMLDFMSHGFLSGVQAMGRLPGLEFLSAASEATVLYVGQILSAMLLVSSTLLATDTVLRILGTIFPNAVDLPLPGEKKGWGREDFGTPVLNERFGLYSSDTTTEQKFHGEGSYVMTDVSALQYSTIGKPYFQPVFTPANSLPFDEDKVTAQSQLVSF